MKKLKTMIKDIFYNACHKLIRINLLLVVLLIGTLSSCVEDIVVYRTETKEMMGDYLERRSDEFSEFNRMLDTTKVMGLLKAYGEYTCFAPTNDALFAFYHSQGRTSLNEYPLDTIKMMVFNHIIKGDILTSDLFNYGRLPDQSMNERYINIDTVHIGSNIVLKVNKTASLLEKDHLVNNGVVHVISEVLNPSQLTSIEAIAKDSTFSLFYQALQLTRLTDKLLLTKDENYHWEDYKSLLTPPFTQGGGSVDELPLSRKFGFTLLMESDATYRDKYGITNIEQLKAKAKEIYDQVYPEDAGITDITNPRNSLNRFIAYHMINKQLSYSKFINDYDTQHMIKTYDMYEYIETMCPNTLMEVRIVRSVPGANFINMVNSTDDAVQIVKSNSDNDATNGVYHEIDKILAYDINVSTHMSSIRLRMDAASFFPELTNNNMRGNGKVQSWVFPKGYIDGLTCTETTRFCYLNSFGGYLDYEGDEVYLKGVYDFSVKTPPIPAGTYEIRFGYQPTGGRGVAQLYWDSIPCGIPLDLRLNADDPMIGYVQPSSANLDDPYGYENDKMMRNRGYMKGPSSYQDFIDMGWGYGLKQSARNNIHCLRKILGIYTFDKPGKHSFTVKAVIDGQFMFDFLEFIPVELIQSEGID